MHLTGPEELLFVFSKVGSGFFPPQAIIGRLPAWCRSSTKDATRLGALAAVFLSNEPLREKPYQLVIRTSFPKTPRKDGPANCGLQNIGRGRRRGTGPVDQLSSRVVWAERVYQLRRHHVKAKPRLNQHAVRQWPRKRKRISDHETGTSVRRSDCVEDRSCLNQSYLTYSWASTRILRYRKIGF
jgi:hypothetical protein